jgi:hypothetical protein
MNHLLSVPSKKAVLFLRRIENEQIAAAINAGFGFPERWAHRGIGTEYGRDCR